MKKKLILKFSILAISIFLLCTSIFTYFDSNPDRYKVKSTDKEYIHSSKKEEDANTIEEDANTIEDLPIEIVEKSDNSNPSTVVKTPIITYSCPEGYHLHETQCIMKKEAISSCGDMAPYSYENLSGCIVLSEGTNSLDGTCPDGQGILEEIHLGSESTYKCYTIHPKMYSCEDGFQLSNHLCVKTIDAYKTES